MKKFHDLRCQKGMTLVELVMVIVIIFILAGISVPMWYSYMPAMRLNGAARNLQMALALTRMKAVAKNRRVALVLKKDTDVSSSFYGTDYRHQIFESPNWVNDPSMDRPVYPTDLSQQGITITPDSVFSDAAGGGKMIIFNSLGSCVDTSSNIINAGGSGSASVELKNNQNKTRKINIATRTGLINLE
jgi:prepilin-type N-terminal cleavage/methylation domain-containing protein